MTGTAAGARAGGSWGWRMLLPPGWATLPAGDAERSRAAVRRLVDRQLSHLPRDKTATARRALSRDLMAQLGDARRAGATEVHTLVELLRGLPVTAGLTVVPLAPQDGGLELLTALEAVFADSTGVVSTTPGRLGTQPALRRHRRVQAPVPEGAPEGPRPWRTHVDWVVRLPDGDHLVLAFATETEPIAAELVELFDAIAGSLELIPAAD